MLEGRTGGLPANLRYAAAAMVGAYKFREYTIKLVGSSVHLEGNRWNSQTAVCISIQNQIDEQIKKITWQ